MKGKLIVIDGTDGSGKATQANLLAERLRNEGFKVETVDFPQYGKKSAALAEEYLNGSFGTADDVGPYRASVFFACDRYEAAPRIRKWLEQGRIVISNRYVSANMGHQAGKIRETAERDRFLEWLDNLEYNIFKIPRPDIQILLFVPPETGQKLVDKKGHRDYVGGEARDMHENDIEHLKNASETYKYVAEKFSWIILNCAPENKLMSRKDISSALWKKIEHLIK